MPNHECLVVVALGPSFARVNKESIAFRSIPKPHSRRFEFDFEGKKKRDISSSCQQRIGNQNDSPGLGILFFSFKYVILRLGKKGQNDALLKQFTHMGNLSYDIEPAEVRVSRIGFFL